jgi:uncharacterized protein (DUF2384 family)
MDIRDGLAKSLLPDFETALSQVPSMLNSFDESTDDALLVDTQSAETLALSRLVFGSIEETLRYLRKPSKRLAGKTPLDCIKAGGAERDEVITDLIRLIEGYVF